jgi:hypothetical protein
MEIKQALLHGENFAQQGCYRMMFLAQIAKPLPMHVGKVQFFHS